MKVMTPSATRLSAWSELLTELCMIHPTTDVAIGTSEPQYVGPNELRGKHPDQLW